jgi:hypothetical protein
MSWRCLLAIGLALRPAFTFKNGFLTRKPSIASPSLIQRYLTGHERGGRRVSPLVPPAGAAPMYAPGAAPEAGPLVAATPDPTTPDPDPMKHNVSFAFGPHPSSGGQRLTMDNNAIASERGNYVLHYVKDVDTRLRAGTNEHLRVITPSSVIEPRNWTEFWPHQRPFDEVWVVPPMQRDIISWTNRNLAHAVANVSEGVGHMVHEAILRHTRDMVQRMREKPLDPTRPPPPTTTWAPPPAIAPPAAPRAAPAVAIPAAPAAPAAPGPPEGHEIDGFGYMLGPDGEYYKIPLCGGEGCPMDTTTMGPTTPAISTTLPMIQGSNGRMYVMPKTPAMVMGPNGRYYAAR